MKRILRSGLFFGAHPAKWILAFCLPAVLLACGDSSERVLTRIRYLQGKSQYEEALDVAVKGAANTRGKDRAEILLKGAEMAFTLSSTTGKKAYALQAIQTIKTVMDEKKIVDGRPEALASKIFEAHGKIDKSSKYLQLAEKKAALENKEQAGNHRIDLVRLYRKSKLRQQAIIEAKVFLSKYPQHPRRADLESLLSEMEAEQTAEWNAQYSPADNASR